MVATASFSDPLPGVTIETDKGEIIIALEFVTRTIGVHGPPDVTVGDVVAVISELAETATAEQEFPFNATEDDPMIFEQSFFWQTIEF